MKMTNKCSEVYLSEVPIYKMYVPLIYETFFVGGHNAHNARDRLLVIMKELYHRDKEEFSVVVQACITASQAVEHLRLEQENFNQEVGE